MSLSSSTLLVVIFTVWNWRAKGKFQSFLKDLISMWLAGSGLIAQGAVLKLHLNHLIFYLGFIEAPKYFSVMEMNLLIKRKTENSGGNWIYWLWADKIFLFNVLLNSEVKHKYIYKSSCAGSDQKSVLLSAVGTGGTCSYSAEFTPVQQ